MVILASSWTPGASGTGLNEYPLDVIRYTLTIEPDIDKGFIDGTLIINFHVDPKAKSIVLDAGNLNVHEVTGNNVAAFSKNQNKLHIELSGRTQKENEIIIKYDGNPQNGLQFYSETGEAYTVYFTSQWMVSHDSFHDRASLHLNILVPKGKKCIASGELIGTGKRGDKTLFQWRQTYETPSYTYGFALGDFNEASDQVGNIKLNYYSSRLSGEVLKRVFVETGNILQFFEQKSGVSYIQNSYSQILIGRHYQEMSGLSVLNASYASSVLKDSSEIHLTSHELAHQWWGNMITCKNLDHFWLNEAFAVYMASAFNEHKFGVEKYNSDIALYKSIYDGLVERNKDKPLVFTGWEASRDNRHVVYYKGAYVLHLLRQELGDDAFWAGIKSYSQEYFGKSVETIDFQQAMEKSTGRDLGDFFRKWVYEK